MSPRPNIQNGRLAYKDNVFVNAAVPERTLVQYKDILICVRNGSRDLIGKCAIIDRQAKGMAFGAFMSIFRSDKNEYIFRVFQSVIMRRQINEHLGATINQITNKSLSSFRVPLPPTDQEQQAITEALNDADALIEGLEKLIAKKRLIKQGAMHELLTGERRLPGFNGEWASRKLGSLGVFLKGSGVRKGQAESGDLPCVRYGEIYTDHHNVLRTFRSFISYEVAATATRIRIGDILFAGSGETKEEIGKCVAVTTSVEAYAGGDIVILRTTGHNPVFLGYALNLPEVQRQKASKGQGDAVVHISALALGSIDIALPDQEEQMAIAQIISEIDNELEALIARLAKARQIKQGMMQELLTGRIRLV